MEDRDEVVNDLRAEMQGVVSKSGLAAPALPPWVGDRINASNRGELWSPWAWRSHEKADPWWCYFGVDRVRVMPEKTRVRDVDGNFFVFAHRGHGINSYGLGIVARFGPLIVDQQTLWGGGYLNPEESTARANAAIESWNRSLSGFLDLTEQLPGPDGSLVRVRYSDYRDEAGVDLMLPDGEFVDLADHGVPSALVDAVDVAQRYCEMVDRAVETAMRPRPEERPAPDASPVERRPRPDRGRRQTRMHRFRRWLADRIRQLG